MIDFQIPIVGLVAYSGTGKTTLLSQLISLLTEKGYNIGIIKHSHHNIDIDKPGKDSYRLREAGAQQTILSSPKRTAVIIETQKHQEDSLENALSHLQIDSLDLVLVEGFKHETFTKIELHRKAVSSHYLYTNDKNIIAVATDDKTENHREIDQLNINKIEEICDYIENIFFKTASDLYRIA